MSAGSKLHHAYAATDLAEAAFEASQGVVTDETDAAEAFAQLAWDDALKSLCGLRVHCGHGQAAIDAERERLDAAEARINKATAWADGEIGAILKARGVKKATTGTFQVSQHAPSHSAIVPPSVVVVDLEPSLRTWKPPTSTDGYWQADKKAIKKVLRSEDGKVPGCRLNTKPGKIVIR